LKRRKGTPNCCRPGVGSQDGDTLEYAVFLEYHSEKGGSDPAAMPVAVGFAASSVRREGPEYGELSKPVISRFYGIVVKMYFSQSEHGVPHFHAIYGEYNAMFSIDPIGLMEGDLPHRARKLATEWAALHQAELLRMWSTQEFRQLPGLE
jgi:hypothetical protein